MSIRGLIVIGMIVTASAFSARADDAAKPTTKGKSSAACAEHAKAMHGMKTHAEREAYCKAHEDCMAHHCAGGGEHKHAHSGASHKAPAKTAPAPSTTTPAPATAQPKG
jgi:hypothetical protein